MEILYIAAPLVLPLQFLFSRCISLFHTIFHLGIVFHRSNFFRMLPETSHSNKKCSIASLQILHSPHSGVVLIPYQSILSRVANLSEIASLNLNFHSGEP